MADNSIYSDIAKRTGGDIYIGVVGPVRTGKSTFIHHFIESAVLPNIENEFDRQRTQDEIPQSASGKTVMTTEPKFVPDESVKIKLDGDITFSVKLIDCVGYMVDGALGAYEDGSDRMVMTPWSNEAMPFCKAAEIGTGKVIGEHSTIGMLVTTDGSICDIPRESYIPAEERVARELKALGKPFAIILNSANPAGEDAHKLAQELEEKYSAPVALVCCTELNSDDIREIMRLVLGEFPMKMMTFKMPEWTEALPDGHAIRTSMLTKITEFADKIEKLGDLERTSADEFVKVSVNAGDGSAEFDIPIAKEEYYSAVSELTGLPIESERDMLMTVRELAEMKRKYEKVERALADVEEKGYGVVLPSPDELKLEEPRLVKSGAGYGVKVTAHADSIHMIRADIKADVCPVVGSEEQSVQVVKFLSDEMEEDPARVWNSNMFGKSLYDLVSDGMSAKLAHIPDDSREKLGETIGKIVNDGANGLICILL